MIHPLILLNKIIDKNCEVKEEGTVSTHDNSKKCVNCEFTTKTLTYGEKNLL